MGIGAVTTSPFGPRSYVAGETRARCLTCSPRPSAMGGLPPGPELASHASRPALRPDVLPPGVHHRPPLVEQVRPPIRAPARSGDDPVRLSAAISSITESPPGDNPSIRATVSSSLRWAG